MTQPEHDLARPAPVDFTPSSRLAEVVTLLDDFAVLTSESDTLLRRIEQATGLRVGELHVLLAVAHGTSRPRSIARRIGQPDHAADATIERLVQRGLLDWGQDDTANDLPAGVLRRTDTGAAVLEQTQGVQIRILDTLVTHLGRDGVAALRTTLQAVGELLRTLGSQASGDRDHAVQSGHSSPPSPAHAQP